MEQPPSCLGRLGLQLPGSRAAFVDVALGDEEDPLAAGVRPGSLGGARVGEPSSHLAVGRFHEADGVRFVGADKYRRV